MTSRAEHLEMEICYIMRAMWAFLSYGAFCVLCVVLLMYLEPQTAIGVYHSVPAMMECLLAGCAVTLAFGVLSEYLVGR